MYSPVWFRPIDAFTEGPPAEPLHVGLDLARNGGWAATDVEAVVTPSGAIVYPGLGRHREPLTEQPRRYRARFQASVYLPTYRRDRDGLEFIAPLYNDTNPPNALAMPFTVELLPSLRYRFPAGIPILRGQVVAASGAPVADALVETQLNPGPVVRRERTLSESGGGFGLPVRWPVPGVSVVIVATDLRSLPNRTGAIAVQFPGAFGVSHTITVL
jgi:hypothetical protein